MAENTFYDIDTLNKCNRCGACSKVCPVYAELGVESGLCRGKVQMIKAIQAGEMVLTPVIAKKLDICLQCKRCTDNCPGGADGASIIRWGRATGQKQVGTHWLYNLIVRFWLPKRWLFSTSLAMGKWGQKILFRQLQGQGQVPRIPLGLDKRRVIPNVAPKTLRQLLPEHNPVKNPKQKVAYFAGCMATYIYPQVGQSLVRVLNNLDIDVTIPKMQHCCGMPSYASGDDQIAKLMAKANLEVFAALDCDVIITSCGSCGLALKDHYAEVFRDDPKLLAQAQKVAAKIQDISEYLTGLDFADKLNPTDLELTYHDPCHLKYGLKISQEPRQIIKSIPSISFKDTPDGLCCGSGGSFSLKHYETSLGITNRALANLEASGAKTIATGCLACRMQLEDSIAQQSKDLKVLHLVEVLDRAMAR